MYSTLELAKKLIKFPTVTPNDVGIIAFVRFLLEPLGFRCTEIEFCEDGYKNVKNLYAVYGNAKPVLCFAGHLDVVPAGELKAWSHGPFTPTLQDGKLIGRGAVDMKGAVAAFLSAAMKFVSNNKDIQGSIGILLTLDEEDTGVNGTIKMLKHLDESGEIFDYCIVGEPTSAQSFGDMIKNGRRGSITFNLNVNGVQGHVAYPENAKNPNHILVKILSELIELKLDEGSEYFAPSNLEVSSIDVGNCVTNIIPEKASATFNIRFSDIHTCKSLRVLVDEICKKYSDDYELNIISESESFISRSEFLEGIVKIAIKQVLNIPAVTSTDGGTSDARHISKYCPVIEFGLLNESAHKINEFCCIDDIEKLSTIYYNIIYRVLSGRIKI